MHLDDERYRGAYYSRGNELPVTAYGYRESSVDMAVLGGERGDAALNLAKLSPGLSLQGSTTAICY